MPITLDSLKAHSQDIAKLSRQYHVTNPRVFGSVATGLATAGSDIDILVDTTDQTTLFDIGGLQQALSLLLDSPVDEIESYMQQWNTIIHELSKLKAQLNDLQHSL